MTVPGIIAVVMAVACFAGIAAVIYGIATIGDNRY